MQFNQAQLRNAIGVSVETFRHWKRVLPPFSGRKKYTLGDLLAAGVLHRLTDRCGVRAGNLPEISKAIVEVCNTEAWASLQGRMLVIDIQNKTCAVVKSARSVSFQDVMVVCPLESVMMQIQEELLGEEPASVQQHLRFPPVAIGNRVQRQRA
ncbi:hypothetical protein [Mesorhizobium sp. RIZ17]|uniref:hypothetical protein n=1 Tax=Mesorhizobium sp. RIZ17 TaxID=3132743 RepID=UPI003DA856A8